MDFGEPVEDQDQEMKIDVEIEPIRERAADSFFQARNEAEPAVDQDDSYIAV